MTASWWQRSVVYEIFLKSFQDSNGDGIGDLPGVTSRIDYLVDLGVGAIWLSPFYQSPLSDAGYDVSDHTAVDPRFGTMDDFLNLVSAAHERGLRVVIDFVPNHTSSRHAWFQESRSSRDNAKRDWYLWRDPAPDGGPPNNWLNRFGRSGWTFDDATSQYYFATFTPNQPELNWRNPDVRQAMSEVLRFWFDRGTDGVRVDAMAHLIKDRRFRDNPPNPGYTDDQEPLNRLAQPYSQNQPELLEVLALLRSVVDEYPDRLLIGEAYQSPEQLVAYQRAGVHMLLATSMLQGPFEAVSLRNIIDQAEALTPDECWPSRSSGNHDIPRLAERVGAANVRLAALLQFTLRGAASMYYGDELGLKHLPVPPERMQDPSGRDNPRYSRDRFRAPMPWEGTASGGFTTGDPWLPLDQATLELNVAAQRDDPASLLNFYRRVLRLRNERSDLQTGDYFPIDVTEPILAFYRGQPGRGVLVALNLSDTPAALEVSGIGGKILLSTHGRNESGTLESTYQLQAREGIVVALDQAATGR